MNSTAAGFKAAAAIGIGVVAMLATTAGSASASAPTTIDSNSDGIYDTLLIDVSGDGLSDVEAYDLDQNLVFERIVFDTDYNGYFEVSAVDWHQDGLLDAVWIDADLDGYFEWSSPLVGATPSFEPAGAVISSPTNPDGLYLLMMTMAAHTGQAVWSTDADGDGYQDGSDADPYDPNYA